MGIDPASLAIIGIAGAGISAASKLEQGQAGAEAAAYQAQVADNNAQIAKQNALTDIQAGETAAVNYGLKTKATVGAQKAGQGAGGVDVNTGSAVGVRAGTEEMGLLDALTIRSNSAKEAYAQQVKATSDTAQSQLDTMTGQQSTEAGELGAAGSLLSGASTVGGKFAGFQQQFGNSGGGSVNPESIG